jgi:hypothetical protein
MRRDFYAGVIFFGMVSFLVFFRLYLQQKEQIRDLQRRVNAISEAVQEGRRHIELEPRSNR